VGLAGGAAPPPQLLVRALQPAVPADHRDARLDQRRLHPPYDALPAREIDAPRLEAEELDDDLVEALAVEVERHLVDRLDVLGGDDGLFLDVAEERDLR